MTHAPTSCLSDTCNNAVFFIFSKQLRQCCRLEPYAAPMAILKSLVYSSVGTPGKTERVVWGETLNRSPRIIFCYIVWDTTDTRALINSSHCDVASREKVNQTGLFPPHNDREECGLRKSFRFYTLINNTSDNKIDLLQFLISCN